MAIIKRLEDILQDILQELNWNEVSMPFIDALINETVRCNFSSYSLSHYKIYTRFIFFVKHYLNEKFFAIIIIEIFKCNCLISFLLMK